MSSIDLNKLPDNPAALKEILIDLQRKYIILEEKFLLLQNKFFSKSSEKLPKEDENQLRLFNEAEQGCESCDDENKEEEPEVIEIRGHSRKKKSGRKPIPDNIPRKEVIHDVSEEEKKCPCCGEERPCIGQEESEELEIIPEQIIVNKHIKKKYGPCKCNESKQNNEKQIVIAKREERIIPNSIVSPGLLAYILVNKFCDALPFYRQTNRFKRINVDISRQNMCNWTILASRKCQLLLSAMLEEIRSGTFIQMDETTLQVLNEPDRSYESKSYMWVTIGYKNGKRIVIYHYHPTRSKEIVLEVLSNFSGYLQTDGYAGYNVETELPNIIHVGCFAHARRYFMDALKVSKNKGSANEAISFIRGLYIIENNLREMDLNDKDFVSRRKELVLPIFEKFKNWLDKKVLQVPGETKIGKAVSYALGEWAKLIRYVEEAFLTPDNNVSENAIRPFVVGRKNWLFSNTPNGAHASACIYSLIESAKANGLEPYRYLRYIFNRLPAIKDEESVKKLLPSRVTQADLPEI
jgi:transposase